MPSPLSEYRSGATHGVEPGYLLYRTKRCADQLAWEVEGRFTTLSVEECEAALRRLRFRVLKMSSRGVLMARRSDALVMIFVCARFHVTRARSEEAVSQLLHDVIRHARHS